MYTADDLEFEAAEVRKALSKKVAFVENQVKLTRAVMPLRADA